MFSSSKASYARTFLLTLSLLFGLSLGSLQAQHRHIDEDYSRVRVMTGSQGLLPLQELGIAVDHGVSKQGYWFESDFSESEIQSMQEAGIEMEILIDDVSKHYAEQAASDPAAQSWRSPGSGSCASIAFRDPADYAIPSLFNLGSMGGMLTLSEMEAELDEMIANYPEIMSDKLFLDSLTHEGRTISYVKISDNPDVDEAEPNVLYMAMLHAREPAGMMTVIFYMHWILENYGTDPYATYVVDNTQMYFIPICNPDGYEINRASNPSGGGLWRKNARDDGGSIGVDLNRNWPFQWGFDNLGSSPFDFSSTYRGPAPASEPEVAAIINLFEDRNFRTAFSYHTFGDLLIYPYGYQAGALTADNSLFIQASIRLTEDNAYSYGTPFSTVGYAVNGGSDDWMYAEQVTKDKAFSWSPEVGSTFWPAPSFVPGYGQENVLANLLLAYFATRYTDVALRAPDLLSARSGSFPLEVRGVGLESQQVEIVAESRSLGLRVASTLKSDLLEFGQLQEMEIPYTIESWVEPGTPLELKLSYEQQGQPFEHSFTFYAGAEEFEGFEQLSSDGIEGIHIGFESIAPFYPSNSNQVLELGEHDLRNLAQASLQFKARWALEKHFDYAVFEIRAVGQEEWQPLCGSYSLEGTSRSYAGAPIYTGIQERIVQESINLDAWVGHEVELRLRLRSDEGRQMEGIYVDDLSLMGISRETASMLTLDNRVETFPNPASEIIKLQYQLSSAGFLSVYNLQGELMLQQKLDHRNGQIDVDVSNWTPGLYTYQIGSGETLSGKFSVIR
jgi:hypothetical protein